MHVQRFTRRHSPNRRKTRVAAQIELDGVLHPATIRDISFEGMKLAVPLEVLPGSALAVHVLGRRIPAIVHWCRAGHAGVHLLARLDADMLIALETADDELAAYR